MSNAFIQFLENLPDEELRKTLEQHFSNWLKVSDFQQLSHAHLQLLQTAIDFMHSDNFDLKAISESYQTSSKRWLDHSPDEGISYGIRFSTTEPQMFTLGLVHPASNIKRISHIRCKYQPDGFFQLYGKGMKLTWDEVLGSLVRCAKLPLFTQKDLQRIDLNHTTLRDSSKDLYKNLSSNFSFFDGE